MPTFRFNSERPYYQYGRLIKRVATRDEIRVSNFDCAILGWNAARLIGKMTLALLFKRNPYRLS